MELPTKMMTQHLNSMLEHLKVSSLIKSRNQSSSSPNSNSNNTTTSTSSPSTIQAKTCNNHTTSFGNSYLNSGTDHVDKSAASGNDDAVILENNTMNRKVSMNTSELSGLATKAAVASVANHCPSSGDNSIDVNHHYTSNCTNNQATVVNNQHPSVTTIFNSLHDSNTIVSNVGSTGPTPVTPVTFTNFTSPQRQRNHHTQQQVDQKRGSITSGSGGGGLLNVGPVANCVGGVTANACGGGQRKQSFVIKPIKLKNVITKAETYDTLHARGVEVSRGIIKGREH